MNVFITGATGLIGQRLTALLEEAGESVTQLTRGPVRNEKQRLWAPDSDTLAPDLLEGCDVLVHLAGESIAEGRWTEAKKQRIRDSRVHSTALLAKTIEGMEQKPKAFVVASAIGFYGDRGEEVLTESSPPGDGFLPEVCNEWEAAATPAREAGVRTVHVRTGIVLAKEGGALKAMITPFKLGVGGIMGDGKQYWSWISLEDISRLFEFAVLNENVHGIVNGTAPEPCTNRDFTKTLGRVIHRPTIFPMPGFAARLALGEMADALILSSARVVPEQTQAFGFQFENPNLEEALESLNL